MRNYIAIAAAILGVLSLGLRLVSQANQTQATQDSSPRVPTEAQKQELITETAAMDDKALALLMKSLQVGFPRMEGGVQIDNVVHHPGRKIEYLFTDLNVSKADFKNQKIPFLIAKPKPDKLKEMCANSFLAQLNQSGIKFIWTHRTKEQVIYQRVTLAPKSCS